MKKIFGFLGSFLVTILMIFSVQLLPAISCEDDSDCSPDQFCWATECHDLDCCHSGTACTPPEECQAVSGNDPPTSGEPCHCVEVSQSQADEAPVATPDEEATSVGAGTEPTAPIGPAPMRY